MSVACAPDPPVHAGRCRRDHLTEYRQVIARPARALTPALSQRETEKPERSCSPPYLMEPRPHVFGLNPTELVHQFFRALVEHPRQHDPDLDEQIPRLAPAG